MPAEDEKKEIKPIIPDENKYGVSNIALTKINSEFFIKYQKKLRAEKISIGYIYLKCIKENVPLKFTFKIW